MRPRGFEPPPRNCRTRPSTWRVYQFRHRRERERESSRRIPARTCRAPARRLVLDCWSDSRERGEKSAPEESPDTVGRGWSRQPDPGKPAGKCHRKEPPKRRGCSSISPPARVKRGGKSAPASRRRGGRANPTRCKAKQGRGRCPP